MPCLKQRLKSPLVQVFVPKLAVEALDEAVLHRAARFDQDVANPMGLRPSDEIAVRLIGFVVGLHGARMPAKQGRSIQQ